MTAWMILLTITGSIGIALMFVGVLMAVLTAVGHKRYIYGILIFALFPTAFVYCFKHKSETAYPAKLLIPGAAVTFLTALLAFGLYHYYGLEFVKR